MFTREPLLLRKNLVRHRTWENGEQTPPSLQLERPAELQGRLGALLSLGKLQLRDVTNLERRPHRGDCDAFAPHNFVRRARLSSKPGRRRGILEP
jgi:hypothetical protein